MQYIIEQILENKKQERWKNNYSLGDLIKDLEGADEEGYIHITKFRLCPTGFTSYRGYYSDLAIKFDTESTCTIKELLEKAKECVGKTFKGYKGGDFTMTKETTLWVANCGDTTDMLVGGIQDLYGDGRYYDLIVKEYKDDN